MLLPSSTFLLLLLPFLTTAHTPLSPRSLARLEHSRRSFTACHKNLHKRNIDSTRLEKRQSLISNYLPNVVPRALPTPSHTPHLPAANPTCVLAVESMEGPYYLAQTDIQPDLRSDQPGTDLLIDLQIINTATCEPVPSIHLSLWHANATGIYSGYESLHTAAESFHRGVVLTDDEGVAHAVTKFPGYYPGRAVHIHLKAFANGTEDDVGGVAFEKSQMWTGQLYFPMETVLGVVNDGVYKAPGRGEVVRNDEDGIFEDAVGGGWDGVMEVEEVEGGMVAWISLGMDFGEDYGEGSADETETEEADEVDEAEEGEEAGDKSDAAKSWWVQSTLGAFAFCGAVLGMAL